MLTELLTSLGQDPVSTNKTLPNFLPRKFQDTTKFEGHWPYPVKPSHCKNENQSPEGAEPCLRPSLAFSFLVLATGQWGREAGASLFYFLAGRE
jgi:hypothetical protein